MGVRTEYTVQIRDFKICSKNVDGICAIQAEYGLLQQLVPELFEPDCGRKLPRLPQNANHLSISAQTLALPGRTDSSHRRKYRLFKACPVGLPGGHEFGHR